MGRKNLPISSITLIFDKSFIKVLIINTNAYCIVYKLKKAQVFVVFIKT